MTAGHRRATDKRLDAAVWGAFFVWVGIALLAHLGWGVTLIGLGIIVVVAEAARKGFGLPVDAFWLVVGALFVVGGAWELVHVQVGLVPILCIAAGVALFISALFRRPNREFHSGP